MNDNNNLDIPTSPATSITEQPEAGITALGVASFMAASNQGSAFDIGMTIAGALPDNKIAQTMGTAKAVANVAQAVQQGSALGVGMALAGVVPGSNFSEAMGKLGAVSSALSAAKQGSMLGAGMALAGVAPGSEFAKVLGQVDHAKSMLDQGMSLLNPNVNPLDLMMSFNNQASEQQPVQASARQSTKSSIPSINGKDGSFVKGEGIKCATCALGNQDAMVGAPVNALYGSKILVGGDDIDHRGIGYLPFVMSRIYNSQNPDTGWFGQGWITQGYEQRLELDPQHNRIYLVDNSGRRVPFTYLAPGHSCYQPTEGITLYRKPLPDDKKHTTASSRPAVSH